VKQLNTYSHARDKIQKQNLYLARDKIQKQNIYLARDKIQKQNIYLARDKIQKQDLYLARDKIQKQNLYLSVADGHSLKSLTLSQTCIIKGWLTVVKRAISKASFIACRSC
jgi:hypothetical protein